jgi:hypothetical protein
MHSEAAGAKLLTCKECRAHFDGRRGWQRFCSVTCRNTWHRARDPKVLNKRIAMMRTALIAAREAMRGKDVEHIWSNYPAEPCVTLGELIDQALKA